MKKIILLQPSLRKNSLTAEILKEFQNLLSKNENYEIETIDLREETLEFCDGRELAGYNADLQKIYQKLKSADIVILWFPVYHYGISGVLKNLLDICGEALTGKKVWVIVSALLPDCHMAYQHFFESFEKKYGIIKIDFVPYICNNEIKDGKMWLLAMGKLQKLIKLL